MRFRRRKDRRPIEFREHEPTTAERREAFRVLTAQSRHPELPQHVLTRINVLETERMEMADRLRTALAAVSAHHQDRGELVAAVIKFDRMIEQVLLADLSGERKIALASRLRDLDEARGSIWATHDAASDALRSERRTGATRDAAR